MTLQTMNYDCFKAWAYSDESLQITGEGWRLEIQPCAPLGDALINIQCALAGLLAHENQLLRPIDENE